MKKLLVSLLVITAALSAWSVRVSHAQIPSGTFSATKTWEARTSTFNFNDTGTQIESARLTGQYVARNDANGNVVRQWSEEAVVLVGTNLIEQLSNVGINAGTLNTAMLNLIYGTKNDTNVVWQ